MRKVIILSFVLSLLTILSGCGEEPLKFRNLTEADQYIRNNIQNFTLEEFRGLSKSNSELDEEDLDYLKSILKDETSSFHLSVGDKFYRFNHEKYLMYMTKWEKINGTFYLEEVLYVKQD